MGLKIVGFFFVKGKMVSLFFGNLFLYKHVVFKFKSRHGILCFLLIYILYPNQSNILNIHVHLNFISKHEIILYI
jgi:hypothetical protein